MTVKGQSGLHVSIHEAACIDYAGMNLRRSEGTNFRAQLTPGLTNAAVVRQAPFNTPWRTLQIANNGAGLIESSLILNLNEPNKLGDVSWFKPMKYVGVWWEMHLELKTWNAGPKHGATTENTIKHIDFAAKHGLGGVLGRRLEQGLGRPVVRQWFGLQLHRGLSRFRYRGGLRPCPVQRRAADRPPRDRRQRLPLRTAA